MIVCQDGVSDDYQHHLLINQQHRIQHQANEIQISDSSLELLYSNTEIRLGEQSYDHVFNILSAPLACYFEVGQAVSV